MKADQESSNYMNTYYTIDENDIRHYGVLGMKWGVRRYQDASGRLTAEGKKKIKAKASAQLGKYQKRYAKRMAKAEKKFHKAEKKTYGLFKNEEKAAKLTYKAKKKVYRANKQLNKGKRFYESMKKVYAKNNIKLSSEDRRIGEGYIKTLEKQTRNMYMSDYLNK